MCYGCVLFFFQAEDGIRDLVRSRGLGDVYKRQEPMGSGGFPDAVFQLVHNFAYLGNAAFQVAPDVDLADALLEILAQILLRLFEIALHALAALDQFAPCLLYTSDAADERSSVDLGGRRLINKKKQKKEKKNKHSSRHTI